MQTMKLWTGSNIAQENLFEEKKKGVQEKSCIFSEKKLFYECNDWKMVEKTCASDAVDIFLPYHDIE